MSFEIDPKLLKIVALAKAGIGGEKETAIRLVKQICRREGIDFDTVMQGNEQHLEFVLPMKYKTSQELRILAQVCFRFGSTNSSEFGVGNNSYRKVVFVTTTREKFIDVCHASAVYLTAYRKQRRQIVEDFTGAFVQKNRLFREPTDEEIDAINNRTDTLEDRQRRWRQANLMQTMDKVPFHKAIEGGSNRLK